eukprot:INCI7084.4.p1 GENE.INCI7084.4~~INCI7084.4.p1  ORF type:complete len:1903 (+),score=332.97 INCI7084.4:664-5709(+)
MAGSDLKPDALEGNYASPITSPLAVAAPAYDHEMVTTQVDASSGGLLQFELEWGLPTTSDVDCLAVFPKIPHPCSATDCTTATLGNKRCNPNNNVCGCGWDGGDCCGDSGQANQYTLCSVHADGTCCVDPDEPATGEVVVEYLVRGRNMEWSAKDLKFLDTWLPLQTLTKVLNTTGANLKTDSLGPAKIEVEVPPHYGLPCVPDPGCFGELGCDTTCPGGQLTTFRVRQGAGHDTRIGWAVWDFSFEASRDTHLTVMEHQLVITEYNTTGDQCVIWRCSPENGVAECPMGPGLNLSRLEQVGCRWLEIEDPDPTIVYARPDRCNEDSFYCEFMNYVTEDGLNASFDLALHSLPPTSPVTVHIHADPEASLREINFLQQIHVYPDTVIFDASNYTSTVQINIAADDDEWFEDLHWANIHINVTAAQESFRRMEHWLWVAVVDNERPEIIVDPLAVTVYETDGGLYNQPVIDLELSDGTAVYYIYLLSRPRRKYVDVFIHIDEKQITTNTSVVRCTADNWDIPQGVLVTAVNDYVDEDHPFFEDRRLFNITHTSASDDEFYNNLQVPSVLVTIVDDDNAELLVSRQVLAFEYDTPTDVYTITLQSEPAYTVYFNLSSIWPTFEISPSFFQIEPEDWRQPVMIHTSGAGTDWSIGGLIVFLTGTALDGGPLAEPEGERAINLIHNLSSLDPNYQWVDNLENEYNYTQPAWERIGIIEPLPPVLEEGYQMNRYSIALKFPPVANVTVTCSAPPDQAMLSHWSCTNCNNISLVKWTSVRGATIDLEFDVDNWETEKVVWVEALDDNVLEYNHTITINHTAQSVDAIYDSDLAPLPCFFPPCPDFDWSSAEFWKFQQNTTLFDEDFKVQIDDMIFIVIDRAAAILTFEEVPPILVAETSGDDDGDGMNDDVNRFDRLSYAPLEEDRHLVVAEGGRAVSYSIHLTQPPKIRAGSNNLVELRMSASNCNGRLLFNISSPEYNQTWVDDIYEEKTFSMYFSRDDFDVPHNVTVTLLQDLQYHETTMCTLITISTAGDQLFATDRTDHQYRWQDPRGIVWFAPQISTFGFNGDLDVTMLDDEPVWMDQAFYRQAGISLSLISVGIIGMLVLSDLFHVPTGNLLSMALIIQQLVLTGDLVRDMTDVYTTFSDSMSWALVRRSSILDSTDDFTEHLVALFGEGVVYSIGPFYLETWIGCGAVLAGTFALRGVCWFLVTFVRFAMFSMNTAEQREQHAKATERKKAAKYKRDKAAAMRRIERRMKRQEEIQRKKEAAETRAALVLEEDAARKAVGSSGKKSRIVPIGLLDDIPDASDDDEGADNATHNSKVGQKASSLKEKSAHSADSDERSDSSEASAEEDADERAEQTAAVVKDGASVNYDAIVEAQAQSRLQREVAAANAEELEKVTQARRARDKAALTGALEEFYDKYSPDKRGNAGLLSDLCHADGNQLLELFQRLSEAYGDVPSWEPEEVSIIETDLQSKVEAARAAAAAAESKETEDAKQRRSQIEQEAEKDLQRQEATKKSLFSEKDLTASDWAWNAAAQHRFQRRVQQRLSFPRWEFAAFVFCLGGAIFSSSMRTTRSLLECPSAAGALADTFDAPCDNDVVARDPSATLSNGSLPIVYRYRYVDDDGLYKTVAVTSTDAFSEKLEPAEVWLERNFYWWDTNGSRASTDTTMPQILLSAEVHLAG